ncbi:MAG: aldolase catalytic domain-containing protein [Lachnospiraceae bacterium]|nr:aldolase catalytic domain-containing protein [Lachnospiraceae bacterium]
MAQKGSLLSVREDVRVLDATLRDGGLVNSFNFSDEFVKELYEANVKAGVDYMEFGYRASKELFDESKFGKWKFATDEDIRAIVGDNDTDLKISIMADVGRCDFRNDIKDRSESPVDLIRVACYIHQIPGAIEMIKYCKEKGYEVSCNIMAISKLQESDIAQALEMVCQAGPDCIYIVDSYGSLYPEQISRITEFYQNVTDKYGVALGIHAHNNQQLAFANTIEALKHGVSYLDATMSSMGRGAGNCAMELLLGFLKNPKYSFIPVLKFIETQIPKVKAEGSVWGYDVPYLLTGIMNQHPSAAIECVANKNTNYREFYEGLLDKD